MMSNDRVEMNAENACEEQIEALVDGLNRGDEIAIQRAYQVYQPLLRMIVRRRLSSPLRARVDSQDIVQSIWADLVPVFRRARCQFPDAARLRSFLVRATHNRLVDRQRKHGRVLLRERAIAPEELQVFPGTQHERPSQALQADDVWQRLLSSCAPSHRGILNLKRDGGTSAEIAARLGLHESSVRRILCDLSRRLGHDIKAGASAASRSHG